MNCLKRFRRKQRRQQQENLRREWVKTWNHLVSPYLKIFNDSKLLIGQNPDSFEWTCQLPLPDPSQSPLQQRCWHALPALASGPIAGRMYYHCFSTFERPTSLAIPTFILEVSSSRILHFTRNCGLAYCHSWWEASWITTPHSLSHDFVPTIQGNPDVFVFSK